ncbi:RNA pseudouridine synthase [Myxococcota bacterium]|nr:RNA pseudouridine synthase [Myxococcota bacterium]
MSASDTSPPPSPLPPAEPPAPDAPALLGTWGEILVVHKPAGMRVHPADEDGGPDLVAWLDAQPDVPPGCKPIHRLDAGASGLVLCAADADARAEVSGMLARDEIHRLYVALVHGRTHRKGIIRRPLQDQRRGRPLPAVTRYKRIDWIGAFTLVEVRIESGRKHQIRRHLQGLGHAVVGDERYPPPRFRAVPGFPGRLWLHALALELPDGTIVEDPLPPELEAHLAHMQAVRED